MPIYAYRCEACGFAKDVLQKMSDDALTVCPSSSKDSFKKQLTAASFQLKGSGWYVTDFRGGDSEAQTSKSADTEVAAPVVADKKTAETGAAATPASAPAASTPAPAASSAAPASKTAPSDSASKAA